MSYADAEADRRLGNVLALGVVTEVGASTAAVQLGDVTTPQIPVGQMRAGALSFYWMPTVGEQVLVGCPSGDVSRAVIICSVFAGNAPSANSAIPVIDLGGGEMQLRGRLVVTDDVIASGISLKSHVHGDVAAGGDTTGEPQ